MSKHMPDVACQPQKNPLGTLNWVGMSGIELPIQIPTEQASPLVLSSLVQAYVSLDDPLSKGIHMSRLYLLLDQLGPKEALTPERIEQLLRGFVSSHEGLSDNALVEFRFDYYERRQSLKSDNSGWKHYPVTLRGELRQGDFYFEISIEVPYSSTCPCSAALSRQLIQEGFEQAFAGKPLNYDDVMAWLGTPEGVSATPHSQRSYAQVKLTVDPKAPFVLSTLINRIEDAVKTPVQSTVKREDEQEFARLNATNLMFCEDAARRVRAEMDRYEEYQDYWIRVNHLESLHPHDAVAIVTKNVPNGYRDEPNYMDRFEH